MKHVIGIDFDNTISCCDHIFHEEALSLGLIEQDDPKDKTSIRDHIRTHHGDIAWQQLQGKVYGPRMKDAELIPGVKNFLILCRAHGEKIYVISHKTEFARYDETHTNLREAALQWMAQEFFLNTGEWGISRDDIFFESTRAEKIARIRALGCAIFIDDLVEVLLDKNFDKKINKILLNRKGESPSPHLTVLTSWQEITIHVFGSKLD